MACFFLRAPFDIWTLGSMDTGEHAPDLTSTELIPLSTLSRSARRNVEGANDFSNGTDLYPESDDGCLQHNHAWTGHNSGDTLTSKVTEQTLIARFFAFIMSGQPLLIRSSPALGTSSYGALPVTDSGPSFTSSQSSDDEADDVRRMNKRKESESHSLVAAGHMEACRSDPELLHRLGPKSRRGRPSTQASESPVGVEWKGSYPKRETLPRKLQSGRGGQSNSHSATSSTDRSSQSSQEQRFTEEDPYDNSPYPQVRASVPATDNMTLSISTPRMWILSMLFAFAGSATNLFFSLRYPSVTITPVIALVLVHPLGKLWDMLLKRQNDPEQTFLDGVRQGHTSEQQSLSHRFRLWLAQGRWNEKEHACVYISSNVSFGFAFATDVIVEQHKFYKQDVPILYQILLTISTQILGYAFAGLTRRFLVRPAAMIWPGTLMSTAMFTTMHKQENEPANGWTVSRYRFFVYVWAGAFAWYFLPGFLFPALSYFNVITWFAPKNVVVANLVRQRSSQQCSQLIDPVWRGIGPWIISCHI